MKKTIKKEFIIDAMKMVREIRDPMSAKYYGNMELFLADMEEVRREAAARGVPGFERFREDARASSKI